MLSSKNIVSDKHAEVALREPVMIWEGDSPEVPGPSQLLARRQPPP